MFDGITKREWERWERAERRFRSHPTVCRTLLGLLFAEGVVVGLLLFAFVALLVCICVANPLRNLRLVAFLAINFFYTIRIYYLIVTQRAWKGLPCLEEKDWPRLHALVRETAAAVGAPRIHRIHLHPADFNASVCVDFPFVPGLRRNVLILGYPLLAAFGARGLRGVLAHELGHVAHRDTVHGGALLHVRAFWVSVQLGIFTWMLGPWRRSYLRRIDRYMKPLEREWELAADRSIAEMYGSDTLRETLTCLELRGEDANLDKILRPLAVGEKEAGLSPAAAIRASVRRPIPFEESRRRLSRALRAIVSPMEEHPPLAVRLGVSSADELLPFAAAPQDALETMFGREDALDATVDDLVRPAVEEMAESIRAARSADEAALAEISDGDMSPDAILKRVGHLFALERKDEALALLRKGRELHPDNAAIEANLLCDTLARAASAEAGAPLADRLEQLVEKEPILRFLAEDVLFAHYLEIGSAERIKALLDLRQHGEKALLRRINAKLRPTDSIEAVALSEDKRRDLAEAFAGRSVGEVYVVGRRYADTGLCSKFYVVRVRSCLSFVSEYDLAEFGEKVGDGAVVAGTRALFRRFAELGIKPIPIPKKAASRD